MEMTKLMVKMFKLFQNHTSDPAYRSCAQNSTWWDAEKQQPFTNYEKCPDKDLFNVSTSGQLAVHNGGNDSFSSFLSQTYDAVNKIYIAGYVVSIIFLFVATSIFFFFR